MESFETKSGPSVSFRTVFISIVVLWAVYFVLATIRWELFDLGYAVEMMRLRVIVTLGGVAVTLLLWLLLRLFDARKYWIQASAALILAMPAAMLSAPDQQLRLLRNEREDHSDL